MHAFARGRHERLRHHGHAEEDECDQGAKKWPEEATDHSSRVGMRMRSVKLPSVKSRARALLGRSRPPRAPKRVSGTLMAFRRTADTIEVTPMQPIPAAAMAEAAGGRIPGPDAYRRPVGRAKRCSERVHLCSGRNLRRLSAASLSLRQSFQNPSSLWEPRRTRRSV
jgi:hypothetical protein